MVVHTYISTHLHLSFSSLKYCFVKSFRAWELQRLRAFEPAWKLERELLWYLSSSKALKLETLKLHQGCSQSQKLSTLKLPSSKALNEAPKLQSLMKVMTYAHFRVAPAPSLTSSLCSRGRQAAQPTNQPPDRKLQVLSTNDSGHLPNNLFCAMPQQQQQPHHHQHSATTKSAGTRLRNFFIHNIFLLQMIYEGLAL